MCSSNGKQASDFMGLRGEAGEPGMKYTNRKMCMIGNVIEGMKGKDSMI